MLQIRIKTVVIIDGDVYYSKYSTLEMLKVEKQLKEFKLIHLVYILHNFNCNQFTG